MSLGYFIVLLGSFLCLLLPLALQLHTEYPACNINSAAYYPIRLLLGTEAPYIAPNRTGFFLFHYILQWYALEVIKIVLQLAAPLQTLLAQQLCEAL